jgi:hypothetical protein
MTAMGGDEAFDKFKMEILDAAVYEDWQGVWEPLWWLRGGGVVAGQSERERQAWAERALRELYAEGLIFFFPVSDRGDVNEAAESGVRLSENEVDATLRSDWWRGDILIGVTVWWGSTKAGGAHIKTRTGS